MGTFRKRGRVVVLEVGVDHAGGIEEFMAHAPGFVDPGQQEQRVGVEAGGDDHMQVFG
jgi:hypothetical protein